MPERIALQALNISKTFGGIHALRNVTLDIRKGEVLALTGENGAGKSTFVKILNGIIHDYQGQVILHGKHVHWYSPIEAQEDGIGYIPQELSLVPGMTVAENIFLGREPRKSLRRVNLKIMEKESIALLKDLGADFSPQIKVSRLGAGDQQIIEIARALSMQGKILIMDEPTAALAGKEIERLFAVIKDLRNEGRSVIYISHKIDEVVQIADRVAVLKDGELVWQKSADELTKEHIISAMVGRSMSDVQQSHVSHSQEHAIISVQNLSLFRKVRDVSFDVREGEILGLTGLLGSGRTEVLLALYGVLKPKTGRITFFDRQYSFHGPTEAAGNGFALVPEDRKNQGLILDHSVSNNIVLSMLKRLTKFGVLSRRKEAEIVLKMINLFQIKVDRPTISVKSLSGGNQQKVVLAKCMANQPRILLLDEATHGIDVGAKQEIFKFIKDLNKKGVTIIMASSELPELLMLCDRIVVLKDGKTAGILTHQEATEKKIIRLAAGGTVL